MQYTHFWPCCWKWIPIRISRCWSCSYWNTQAGCLLWALSFYFSSFPSVSILLSSLPSLILFLLPPSILSFPNCFFLSFFSCYLASLLSSILPTLSFHSFLPSFLLFALCFLLFILLPVFVHLFLSLFPFVLKSLLLSFFHLPTLPSFIPAVLCGPYSFSSHFLPLFLLSFPLPTLHYPFIPSVILHLIVSFSPLSFYHFPLHQIIRKRNPLHLKAGKSPKTAGASISSSSNFKLYSRLWVTLDTMTARQRTQGIYNQRAQRVFFKGSCFIHFNVDFSSAILDKGWNVYMVNDMFIVKGCNLTFFMLYII